MPTPSELALTATQGAFLFSIGVACGFLLNSLIVRYVDAYSRWLRDHPEPGRRREFDWRNRRRDDG